MFCLCGNELKQDAQFCNKCGTKITCSKSKAKQKSSSAFKYAAAGALLALLAIAGFFILRQITMESGIASYRAADSEYFSDAYTRDAFVEAEESAEESNAPQEQYGNAEYEPDEFCTHEHGKRVATEFLSNFTTLFLDDWATRHNFHHSMLGLKVVEFSFAERDFLLTAGHRFLMPDSRNTNPAMVPLVFYNDLSLGIFDYASGFLLFDIHENGIPLIAVLYDSWVADRTWDTPLIYTLFNYIDGGYVKIGEMELSNIFADNEGNLFVRYNWFCVQSEGTIISSVSFTDTISKETIARVSRYFSDYDLDLITEISEFDTQYYFAPGMPWTDFRPLHMPELSAQIKEYLTPIMQQRAEEAIANPPTPPPALVDLRLRHDMQSILQSSRELILEAASIYIDDYFALLIISGDAWGGSAWQEYELHPFALERGSNFFTRHEPINLRVRAGLDEVSVFVHPNEKSFSTIHWGYRPPGWQGMRSSYFHSWRQVERYAILDNRFVGSPQENSALGVFPAFLGSSAQEAVDRLHSLESFNFQSIAAGAYYSFERRNFDISEVDFIFPYSNTQYICADFVATMCDESLRIARNEIYARHGRMFTNEELQRHFNSLRWYTPRLPLGTEPTLSSIEQRNIAIIVAEERRRR